MAAPVFCNVCFRQPCTALPRFSLTSCGHVVCGPCLQTGNKDECLVCRAPCRTVFLSKKTNPEIQSLFMGIDTLCKKYSREITQISEFQEKHRRHLLTYYKGKIAKLEESLKKATQQIHQIQCMRPPQQTTRPPVIASVRNPISTKQNGYSPYSLHPNCPSSSEMIESMEVDPITSPMRKPETSTGPTRLSLISPPHDGRMGSVSYKSCQSSGLTASQKSTAGSVRLTPLRMPHNERSFTSSYGSQRTRIGMQDTSGFRTPQLYACTPPSSQSSVTRHPITLSSLLQRQHVGPTNLGGHSVER